MIQLWTNGTFGTLLPAGQSQRGGKDIRQCYTCGQTGHLAWQCTKGMGKAGIQNAGIKGKGQMWELANVNPGLADEIVQTMAIEESVPVWTSNKQEDMNLGGTWDNSTGMVSGNDNDWSVVMRRARGQRDMRPIKFLCIQTDIIAIGTIAWTA